MKLRVLILLTILALIGCSKSPRERATEQIQAGLEHLEKFEFEQAQLAFEKAAAEGQGYPYDKYGKGLTNEQQLYFYDALSEYIDLTELLPDSALAYGGLYRIYAELGYPGMASEAAAKYFELSPESEEAAISNVLGYISSGQMAEARQELLRNKNKALNETSAKLLTALAFSYLNDYDSAQIFLQGTVDFSNLTAFQLSIYADILDKSGKIDSSMSVSRKSIEVSSSRVADLYRHFERALENNYYGDARNAIKLLENKGAIKHVTTALMVMLAKDQNNYIKSRVVNQDFLMSAPKTVSSVMFDMTAGGKQFTDGIQVMSQRNSAELCMRAAKSGEKFRTFVGIQIQLFRSNTDDKLAVLEELGKIQGPMGGTKQVTLTEVYLQYRTGQFDLALKRLKSLRSIHSNEPDWLVEMAGIYADPSIKYLDLALETYEEALAKDKWSRDAFAGKIQILRRQSRFDEALNQFDKFPHFERQFHELALLKAVCLVDNGEFQKALNTVSERGRYLRGNVEPFRELTELLDRKYRPAEILKVAEICNGWTGDNIDAILFACRIYSDQKQFSKGLELSDKALVLEPGLIEARVQKGRALYGLGKRAEAFEQFEEVLKDDPNDGDANYYYSQILGGEKIDHDRTTNLARAALRAFYSDEKAFLNSCRVYNAFGDHKFAYSDALKASLEFPNSAEVMFEFGLASYQLGRANTDQHLKKAIELGLGSENLKKAKEILATF
ncbi:MAG: tetratricopeptide repeat protein [Candidatus Zixiibacteriota bacterium]